MDLQKIIDLLRRREEVMREHIKRSSEIGDEKGRIHYIGWLRGIQGSRNMLEYFRDHDET